MDDGTARKGRKVEAQRTRKKKVNINIDTFVLRQGFSA